MSQVKLTADSGGGTTSLKAPSSTTSNADVVLKLPVADGSANQVLKTDGSGQLSFTSNAGTTINNNADNRVITGSDTANTLNGESNFSYDGTKCLIGTSTELSTSGERSLQIQNTGGPKIALGRNDTSISDGNTIGGIEFYGNDANGTFVNTAAIYVNADGDHGNDDKPTRMQFFTTADGGSSATERMRLDSSGNILAGTTSTSSILKFGSSAVGFAFKGGQPVLTVEASANSQHVGYLGQSGTDTFLGGVGGGSLIFQTGTSGTSRMRIDSTGKLLLGTTTESSSTGAGLVFFGNGAQILKATGSSDHDFLDFYRGTDGSMARVGNIRTTSSSTSYNTSSDYRLKENVTAISDGITRLKTLKPSRFNFIADATKTVDGFLAHEVTAVPEAITGTKDEVDSDNKPVYQGIDQSKLVPLLVAAVQEAVGKIEVLETKVAALEAA